MEKIDQFPYDANEKMESVRLYEKSEKNPEKKRKRGLTIGLKFDNIYKLLARGTNLENDTVKKLEESEAQSRRKTANSGERILRGRHSAG